MTYEQQLIDQAFQHSFIAAENRRLRSCLAEAIARVIELERRLAAVAAAPVRRGPMREEHRVA